MAFGAEDKIVELIFVEKNTTIRQKFSTKNVCKHIKMDYPSFRPLNRQRWSTTFESSEKKISPLIKWSSLIMFLLLLLKARPSKGFYSGLVQAIKQVYSVHMG